jgi:hypothetical protein
MKNSIRIGGASAFYGDSQLAARQLVDKGNVDYLIFDYLAETTMSILARAAKKNPDYGYAVDFVSVAMADVIADCATQNIKVIANAGGVNVPACVKALQRLCTKLDVDLIIAGVYGDDLCAQSGTLRDQGLVDIESGEKLPTELASINAYLGAAPIADALIAGADIVVTGRVVDSALVLAPLMVEFDWQAEEYDKLAQGSLAGHIIECGAQCTGGNFTDWQLVPDFADMSYPIADVSQDGVFTIAIPPATGGLVSIGSVAEQIVYEIGDPANYLLPDVACDFTQVTLQQSGQDEVLVKGARGRAPGNQYKVCATWQDGYRLMGSYYLAGLNAPDKARTGLNAWLQRTEQHFSNKGWPEYRRTSLEIAGAEDIYGPHSNAKFTRDVMAKFGLHHDNRDALIFASRELAYLATSGPPGMTGFAAGRASPQPMMQLHSSLLDKSKVMVSVQLADSVIVEKVYESKSSNSTIYEHEKLPVIVSTSSMVQVPLEKLVYARSGDKGDNANIGIISRKPEFLPYLDSQLTTEVVEQYFAHLISGSVTRFYLPGLGAFNFLLHQALGGGGGSSLRLDSQAKTYAQMLLSLTIEIPEQLAADLPE